MSNKDVNVSLQTIENKIDFLSRQMLVFESSVNKRFKDAALEREEIYKASTFTMPILAWRWIAGVFEKGWAWVKSLFAKKEKPVEVPKP